MLFLIGPPEFQNITETIHARLNKPVTIICDAVGVPVPQVRLSRESKDLKRVTAENSTLSSLTYRISEINVNDLGMYTCTASNKLKSIEKTITLSGEYGTRCFIRIFLLFHTTNTV